MSTHSPNSYDIHKRTVLKLERELGELRCKKEVLKEVQDLYNKQLNRLGDRAPPAGVDLLENSSLPTSNYEGVSRR